MWMHVGRREKIMTVCYVIWSGRAGSWKGRRALTRLLLSLATEQKFEVTSTLFVISYVFLVSQDALEAMFLWCLWALTKRRDNIVLADMVVWIWRWTRWPTKKEKEKSGRHGVGHGGRHGDRQGGRHGGQKKKTLTSTSTSKWKSNLVRELVMGVG